MPEGGLSPLLPPLPDPHLNQLVAVKTMSLTDEWPDPHSSTNSQCIAASNTPATSHPQASGWGWGPPCHPHTKGESWRVGNVPPAWKAFNRKMQFARERERQSVLSSFMAHTNLCRSTDSDFPSTYRSRPVRHPGNSDTAEWKSHREF